MRGWLVDGEGPWVDLGAPSGVSTSTKTTGPISQDVRWEWLATRSVTAYLVAVEDRHAVTFHPLTTPARVTSGDTLCITISAARLNARSDGS